MKNKKMTLKLGLLAIVVWSFSFSFTSAILFHLNIDKIESLNESYLSDNIIPIHFADNGNDFGGFFFFSNGLGSESEGDLNGDTPEDFFTISVDGIDGVEEYECNRQIKGFYYNAERGERLRPLDQDTWSYVGIDTTGGFYTMCKKAGYIGALQQCLEKAGNTTENEDYQKCKEEAREEYATDGDGYYGYVKHTYSGQDMVLIAGVNYDNYNISEDDDKFVSIFENGGFAPNFVRIGNKYPVGFVYDYNGGVGLVGCRAIGKMGIKNILNHYYNNSTNDRMNGLFSEIEGELSYDGTDADCSKAVWDPLIGVVIEGIVGMGEMKNDAKFEVIGNQKDLKMQYFSSADINNNTIINYARKKAALLCRGKKWYSLTDNINANASNENVICINGGGGTMTSPSSDWIRNNKKTLIVKNGDVEIKPFSASSDNNYYDIFIDSGNLIINEEDAGKYVFKTDGFISNSSVDSFEADVATAAANGTYEGVDAAVGSFIRGNFIVNGKIKSANEGSGLINKYFIYGKISTRDDFNTLLETFKWRCNNGIATDGSYCPPSYGEYKNPYEKASLVVIDQNYSSPFFND